MEIATQFDSSITLKYKYGNYFQVPIKYLYKDKDELKPIRELLLTTMDQYPSISKGLTAIYNFLMEHSVDILASEFVGYYVLVSEQSPETVFPSIVEFLSEIDKKNDIENVNKLRDTIFSVQTEIGQQLKKENDGYETIVNDQAELEQLKEIETTEPIIERSIVQYKVWRKAPVDVDIKEWRNKYGTIFPKDGIELFDQAIPSFAVPLVQYNNEDEKPIYRIYHGSSETDDTPDYDILFQLSQYSQPDVLHITVCSLEDKLQKRSELKHDSYIHCTLSLGTGILTVPSPYEKGGISRMKRYILTAFPDMDLELIDEDQIKGNFMLGGIKLCEMSLYYLIQNEPLFGKYLYIDESDGSRAEKKRINMHFKSPGYDLLDDGHPEKVSSLTATFGAMDEEFEDIAPIPTIAGKADFVRLSVSRVKSIQTLNLFIRIFSRLMGQYQEVKSDIEMAIRETLPFSCPEEVVEDGFTTTVTTTTTTTTKRTGKGKKQTESKIKNLERKAPDIYISDVSRFVSVCPAQPIIIQPDEIKEWEDMKIRSHRGGMVKRTVLKFPPEGKEQFYFVCPSDYRPFPFLKSNSLENSGMYPFIPSCQAKETNLDEELQEYTLALKNPALKKKKVGEDIAKKYFGTTSKFQDVGRKARIPDSLSNLLRTGVEPRKGMENFFSRVGMPQTPNSLIHCILYSLQYPEYMELKTPDEQEELAQTVRNDLLNRVHPSIFKQELFDLLESEIAKNFQNPNVFLDPYLYYRGLEEYFNINIFVFNLDRPLHPIPEVMDNEEGPSIEIPRYNLMHIRPNRERNTVLIVKHLGSAGEKPHCEAIVSGFMPKIDDECDECGDIEPENVEFKTMFPPGGMDEILFSLINKFMRHYVWDYPLIAVDPLLTPLEVRDCPFSVEDWEQVFKSKKLIGQRIDLYGKTRELAFEFKKSVVIVLIPPSQPLNLPIINKQYPPISEKTVRELFGPPSEITKNGLWYPVIDYSNGLFCPCVVKSKPTLSIIEPIGNNIQQEKRIENPVSDIRNVKRWASILLQLIIWLWKLGDGTKEFLDFEQWWNIWVIEDDSDERGSIGPNDIKRIYRLPNVLTTEEGLHALFDLDIWSPYFQSNSIHLYPKLYRQTFEYLKKYQTTIEGLKWADLPPATYLEDLYVLDTDFEFRPKSVVFTETSHLKEWLKTQKQHEFSSSMVPIHTRLDLDIGTMSQPYLYQDTAKKMYIIQNVRNGELSRVFNLLTTWYQKKINLGYECPPYVYEDTIVETSQQIVELNISHIIYGISSNETAVPISVFLTDEDKEKGDEAIIYYQMLKFSDTSYAGMIPIF